MGAGAHAQDDCKAGNIQAAEAELDWAAIELGAQGKTKHAWGRGAEPETGTEHSE